jgi:hypothetical protein
MTVARFLTTVALVATVAVPSAAGQGHSKFDDSLRESIASGCTGTKSVIIRTKPGARETLRKSLAAQGRQVKGEFPALDAITVDVSCADLNALARFPETLSISDNAKIHGHQLGGLIQETTTTVAEEPVAPIAEEPVAAVVQEPIAPVAVETVAPVAEEPVAAVVTETVVPVAEEAVAPIAE